MKTIKSIAELRREQQTWFGKRVGFVPTMGYLHEGHLSLVRTAKKENDITIVSIFVNPMQFGPHEDLSRYPRDFAKDSEMLKAEGTDFVFFPPAEEMYPTDFSTQVEVRSLGKKLCGKSRPTHFRGVATIVLKLFNIVQPKHAYFGQKDAQQAIIIKQLVHDLNLDIALRILPIVRAADGLALSSRNTYLSIPERHAALALPRALAHAKQLIIDGERSAKTIALAIRRILAHEITIAIDYIAVVDLANLTPLQRIKPDHTLIACAIKVGKTRLIDNVILGDI